MLRGVGSSVEKGLRLPAVKRSCHSPAIPCPCDSLIISREYASWSRVLVSDVKVAM